MSATKKKEYANAVHQAGRAVMFLIHKQKIKTVTIDLKDDDDTYLRGTLGKRWRKTLEKYRDESTEFNEGEIEKIVVFLIAGELAEELILEKKVALRGSKGNHAFSRTPASRIFLSISQDTRSYSTLRDAWKDKVIKEGKEVLTPYISVIRSIADKLVQRRIITGFLVKRIFKGDLLNEE